MKTLIRTSSLFLAGIALLASCKKFEEINVDPLGANEDQVSVEYLLNHSITEAQMNPDVAERSFVLYWKTAGHQQRSGGISSGGYDDGWSTAYYNQVSIWLGSANSAIRIGNKRIAAGGVEPYVANLVQVGRIWRAYLMSEVSDNFGPIALEGFNSENPGYNDVKSIYYFLLEELKDASAKMDVSLTASNSAKLKDLDPAYQYDYAKWRTYANSLRMRLAMRLSEVDANKAKSEFEAAASGGDYITRMDQAFQVKEAGGWNALTGVMSREWNAQFLSVTLNNLFIGLGGIPSTSQLAADYHPYIKPINYLGLKLEDHFTSKTNDPSAGYWLDGLPNTIDPRAYKAFIPPGDFTNPNFSRHPTYSTAPMTTKRNLLDANNGVVKEIDAKYHWNATVTGDWGVKGARNQLYTFEGTLPRLSQQFRSSTSSRIFFGPWETYFLLAEAEVRGWNTPTDAKTAYEAGIASSFDYWGVSGNLSTYLTSQAYNRVGTSVNWDHVTEPPVSHSMSFVNGYTNTPGNVNIPYPVNTLYKNGTVKNDALTKIITQKFIAQTPWLPLEAWNDQRRLGLPFFENPAIENALTNLPTLTATNFMTSNVKFFPQRLRYPTLISNTNGQGYSQAVTALGGPDAVLTPLWWAKQQ